MVTLTVFIRKFWDGVMHSGDIPAVPAARHVMNVSAVLREPPADAPYFSWLKLLHFLKIMVTNVNYIVRQFRIKSKYS